MTQTSDLSKASRGANEIGHSLTGGQVQEVLDFLIYNGLEPIIVNSTIFDIQLAHMLSVASTNKKRKISALPREVFINKICTALTTNDVLVKVECIANSKLERGFVYNFLVNFLNAADGYSELYTKYLTCGNHMDRMALDKRLSAIENALSFSRANLFQTLNRCRKYVELAYVFRNKIVCQYIKHAYKQAHTYCKAKGTNFEIDEVQQSLMAAITKAIDKYDSSKGALTSYINYWILNALTYASSNYGHEYGVAYQIPQSQKKLIQGAKSDQVNFSISLTDLLDSDIPSSYSDVFASSNTLETDYIQVKESEDTAYLIKCADQHGLARLYLDLTEYISVKEKQRMVRSMKRQLGYSPTAYSDVTQPSQQRRIP